MQISVQIVVLTEREGFDAGTLGPDLHLQG